MDISFKDSFLEHFIICYDVTNCESIKNGYEKLPIVYETIEGTNACKKLVEEIKTMERKQAWKDFVLYTKTFGIELTEEKIKKISEIALKVYENNCC